MTPEDLARLSAEREAAQRTYLRKRYAYLTAELKKAEEFGADAAIVRRLRTLLAFVIRDANQLDSDGRARALAAFATPFIEHAGRERRPGPVRVWLRGFLAKQPKATAAEAWAAIARRQPKGLKVFDNRLGKYIEASDNTTTHYRHFANLVSLERPKK